MQRVVITGLGSVSPLGLATPAFWDALVGGVCGIGPITQVPLDRLSCRIAAEVRGFVPEDHLDPQSVQRLDRFAQFGVVAAREAIRDAGIDFDRDLGLRTAVILGSGIGGLRTLDEGFQRLYVQGSNRVYPLSVPKVMLNAPVSAISAEHGIFGPCFAVSSACSSANHAIIQAFGMVRSGQVEVAVTGGTEACVTFGMIKAWEALRVLAPETCRPFSAERKGIVLGEGAGVLVLESLERARARGARIHAELAGTGMSSDAGDLTLPDPDGAARAMAAALRDGGLEPDEIDYINAHGTGTPANDATETAAIHRVFGDHARHLAVSSTKSMHGHALGAAGGLEAIATVKALAEGIALPTVNFGTPDPACDLDYVPDRARAMPIRAALSNSFAFGGLNAVLAFRRFPD